MKYAIHKDTRKGGDNGILDNQIYNTFEEACAGLNEYLTYDNEPPDDCDDFGGQISKGTFFSEEETLEVIKLNEMNNDYEKLSMSLFSAKLAAERLREEFPALSKYEIGNIDEVISNISAAIYVAEHVEGNLKFKE